MTRFEHIFQKQMLKATHVFIQQHHFIDKENRIFVDYIYQREKWFKKIPSEIWFVECTIYLYNPFEEVLHVYKIIQFDSFQIVLSIPSTHDFRFLTST
jgi:hypothetical protein